MTYTPMPNSVAGRAMAELRRNGRTAERALADTIDTDVDTLRASVWHAEQDGQVRRTKVMGLWWYEVMEPVRPAVTTAIAPAPEPSNEAPKPEALAPAVREKAYMPKPGSFAARAVEYLRQHGATRLNALAAELDIPAQNLKSCLALGIAVDLIHSERRGRETWFRVDPQPAQDGDAVEQAVVATAAAEQLEQRCVDAQERDAQDRMFDGLLIAKCPPLPHEVEKRLRATIQELESALAARDERIAALNALLDQSMPAERPVEISVTLSITGTPHQAERVAAFARSMTEVRG